MSPVLLVVLWEFAVLVAVSVYIAQIGTYPTAEQTFPRLIAYPVAALTIVSLLRRFGRRRSRRASAERETETVDVRALMFGIAFAAGYAALWQLLGFVLDTLLLVTVAPWVLGLRWKGVLGSAVIGAVVVALFGYLFGTSGMATLPAGIFGIDVRW